MTEEQQRYVDEYTAWNDAVETNAALIRNGTHLLVGIGAYIAIAVAYDHIEKLNNDLMFKLTPELRKTAFHLNTIISEYRHAVRNPQ